MKQGVIFSVGASVLFAIVYYTSTLLVPLTAFEVFSWRVLAGLPVLAVFIHFTQQWGDVVAVAQRAAHDRRFLMLTLLSALLFGVQTWLFVWAPMNQMGLDVSLGYFLLPLTMVLVGRVVYKEHLSLLQWLAVAFAALGVGHELWRVGTFSWATALVCFGYPPYFMLRRHLQIRALASLWFDFGFLLLPVLYVLLSQEISLVVRFIESPRFFWQVPVFGVLSSLALLGYIGASRLLPLSLFGLLGYVEPVLLFWVAFLLLYEPIAAAEWWTYIPIWIAVGLLAAEGVRKLRP